MGGEGIKTYTGMMRHLFLLYLNFKSKCITEICLRAIKDIIILFLKKLERKSILELLFPKTFLMKQEVMFITIFG